MYILMTVYCILICIYIYDIILYDTLSIYKHVLFLYISHIFFVCPLKLQTPMLAHASSNTCFCITDVPPKPWHFCRYAAIGQKLKRVYALLQIQRPHKEIGKDLTAWLSRLSTSFKLSATEQRHINYQLHQLHAHEFNPVTQSSRKVVRDWKTCISSNWNWGLPVDTVEQTSMTFDPLVRHQATRERKPDFGWFWCIGHLAPDSPSRCSVHNMHRPEYVAGVVVVSWLQQWQHDQCIAMSCLPLHVHTSTDTFGGLVDAW